MSLKARTAIVLLISSVLVVTTSIAGETRKIEPLQQEDFRPVPTAEPTLSPSPSPTPTATPTVKPVPKHTPNPTPKPTPKPKPTLKLKPRPVYGRMVSGVASWYCVRGVSRCTKGYPDGYHSYYAAIRRDMLFLRGRHVAVCEGKKCLRVKIIDCNCGKHANLIDLYGDAFKYFHPLSKGKFKVKVKW